MRLTITYKSPAQLKPRGNNPRTHTKKQIQQIAASIKEFGFINPVLIDGADGIIAGHGRVEAAKLIGMSDVPAVCVDHLTPAQVRAYVIADNKIAENAGWDRALLALELQELAVDLNFDVTVTGFETAEIDLLIQDLNQGTLDEADQLPEVDRAEPAVSRPGDLWRIGNHALLCGDALNKDSYARLLGSKKAQMVFTDPPYNVAIAGNVSGLGKVKHREFAMASGEMNPGEFTEFLKAAFIRFAQFSSDGSMHFICMDWRHIRELLDAAAEPYQEFTPALEGDKIMRLHGQTAKIEGGFVLFPKKAPWLETYLNELVTFPNAKHDDQVDSTVFALAWNSGGPWAWIKYYHNLAEQMNAGQSGKEKLIRVWVPPPSSTYILITGREVCIPVDRIVEMTEEELRPLINLGARRVD
jgi:ParB-like chromosome segregation protein Spo0J